MAATDGIETVHGIGEKRREKLNAAGIFTVWDMIGYFPRDYEDRSTVTPLRDVLPGGIYTVTATVTGQSTSAVVNGRNVTKTRVRDGDAEMDLVWFSQPYMKTAFRPGVPYVFTGKVTERFGRLQMAAPDYEIADGRPLKNAGRIVPVYVSLAGLSQKALRAIISAALSDFAATLLSDNLPPAVRQAHGLCDKRYAVENIHFPESRAAFFAARQRLVFEELLTMTLALRLLKGTLKQVRGFAIPRPDLSALFRLFPFRLTAAQQRVLDEILADMATDSAMNRLVQGDVGSGKTAVAMAAAFAAIQSGYQAALMAPTEVLAAQHYASFRTVFEQLGIQTVLLSGGLTKKERTAAYAAVASGAAQMVIGTHALIQTGLRFHRLALAMTDEQHRFGVRQRAALSEKNAGGARPNILVLSATPIPRTLGLILYGDLDISVIDALPPGRKPIQTFAVGSAYRERIHVFLEKEIRSGRQVYVICPMIEADETPDRAAFKSVLALTANLAARFPAFTVDCVHGRMKPSDKQAVLERFAAGALRMLVATTVIEVGINVPNASVMLIENAERFGLSQLHQLRGRVGRGGDQAYCIMITDSRSAVAKARMRAMTNTADGFILSEQDLKLRGPGDYFGTRQHGLPEFKIANLFQDTALLKAAQCQAEALFPGGRPTADPAFAALFAAAKAQI